MDKSNSDSQDSQEQLSKFSFVRDGNNVKITLPANEASYEESNQYLSAIKYIISFKVDGTVTTSNADTIDDKTNTYSWNISTFLQKGITLEYKTANNTTKEDTTENNTTNSNTTKNDYIILTVLGGLFVTIIALLIANIAVRRKQ